MSLVSCFPIEVFWWFQNPKWIWEVAFECLIHISKITRLKTTVISHPAHLSLHLQKLLPTISGSGITIPPFALGKTEWSSSLWFLLLYIKPPQNSVMQSKEGCVEWKILSWSSLVNTLSHCPQLFTFFPHAKYTWFLPENFQSLVLLLFQLWEVLIQIRSRCQGGPLVIVLLAQFLSVSSELWVKESGSEIQLDTSYWFLDGSSGLLTSRSFSQLLDPPSPVFGFTPWLTLSFHTKRLTVAAE